MRQIPVKNAIGQVLAHDLTKIVPGFKGACYQRGHVISREDIEELLNMGKEHVYVLEIKEDQVHEEDAALTLARLLAGKNLVLSGPREGKVSLFALSRGLLKVSLQAVHAVNGLGSIVVSTLHTNSVVEEGQTVAATRVIPLMVEKALLDQAGEILSFTAPTLEVLPFKPLRAGVIATGGEVYSGRIKDRFTPVVKDKVRKYGGLVRDQCLAPDNLKTIAGEIRRMKERGLDLIMVTGGMSVDPDDCTPGAIKAAGARVVFYGTPVLPGSMFLMAYLGGTPVIGLPGCVMHAKHTVFDLLLPRIFAGDPIHREEVAALGVGGLCRSCEVCCFPHCSFGK